VRCTTPPPTARAGAGGGGEQGVTLNVFGSGIYPKLLNFLFVYLCWWLMTKKKIGVIPVMLILVGVALVGVLVGFFNPGLSYGG